MKQIPSEAQMQVYTQDTTVKKIKCCIDLEDLEIKEIEGFGLVCGIVSLSGAL